MKSCVKCNTTDTPKWYSGPICKKCYRKDLYHKNPEPQKLKNKKRYHQNPDYAKEYSYKYRKLNPEQTKKACKEWRDAHPEQVKNNRIVYKINNPEKIKQSNKLSYLKRKDKINKRRIERKRTDISFKLAINLRNRIRMAMKRGTKSGSAVRDLGCTVPELKVHLENKFLPDMTWENHGDWHIDHIKPLAKFDLTNLDQFKEACHYTNLQPLWAVDNISKSDK